MANILKICMKNKKFKKIKQTILNNKCQYSLKENNEKFLKKLHIMIQVVLIRMHNLHSMNPGDESQKPRTLALTAMGGSSVVQAIVSINGSPL